MILKYGKFGTQQIKIKSIYEKHPPHIIKMEDIITFIIAIPLFIAAWLLIPFVTGIIGWVIADIFGLGKFIMFNVNDDNSLVATGFWLQWQFWSCVLIGAAHMYVSFLISHNYGELFAYAYFFSIFAIIIIKLKILELLKK